MMNTTKVALITGAAGGLGRAISQQFYMAGYHLVLADINEEGLEELQRALEENGGPEGKIEIMPGDLSDLKYAESLIDTCKNRWNRLDVLVNNAVWRPHDTMRTISPPIWEKTLAIGLTAPAFLTQWGADLMEAHEIPGTIVNISSIQADRAGGTSPAYVACKGAINSLTYECAALYGSSGIRVVGVAPGNINTPLSKDFVDQEGENISDRFREYMDDQTALKRSAHPDEIAKVVFWLTTGEASFVNGTVITADGGFTHGFGSNALKNNQYPGQF